MDSRDLFQFRFVDRFQQKKKVIDFLNGELKVNTLWLSGTQGVGKTRLIREIVEKQCSDKMTYVICSFEESSGNDKLEEFIKLLQNKVSLNFYEFLETNYTSLLDISKQITTQILKLIGIDLSGFISAAYDGTKMFITQKKQQHSAIKVVANYINSILEDQFLVIVFDQFSSCRKETVDLFMQIIGHFVENSKIRFIISTTDEEMNSRSDIRDKLLLKVPVVSLVLESFDEDIYFYEILQEIFDVPNEAKPIVSQIYTICEGSPVRLQVALMELYRNNIIQLCSDDKAKIDFSSLKNIILQKEFGFRLEHYNMQAQMLLRLITGLKEQAPLLLLIQAGEFVIKKLFPGIEVLNNDLSKDINRLYELSIIDFSVDGQSVVKINNPIVRENLKEKFAHDPVHRLFSGILASYLQENKEYITLSLGVSSEWLKQVTIMHSIAGQVTNWIQYALEYGLSKYECNHIYEALEVFTALQSETNSISSTDLIKIVDCFFKAGKYNAAESILQIIESRNDYNKWLFNYYYCRIQNLHLKKDDALKLARAAIIHSHNEEERIKSLNMQQQILVDTTDGKAEAKVIFDSLIEQFKVADSVKQRLILPTLKTAIDFYHSDESFYYLAQAKRIALEDDNQLENAFILTNEGFEYFRQGEIETAENCFKKSAEILFDIRIHEISYPLNNLANCYMSKNMFEEAIAILLRASLWNTSSYAFVTIQTLLMVCYAHIGNHDMSLQTADKLISNIELFNITDTTMLRKIYLNIALVYKYLKRTNCATGYALKAYHFTLHTSSWYRAYELVKDLIHEDKNPMDFCRKGEEWYWTNGSYEPWLITFSHD